MIDENSKKRIHNAIANAVVKVKLGGEFRGTGFVITPDGYVLTAYHCVGEYASNITIETRFGDSFPVELDQGKSLKSREFDIAVLKVYQRGEFACVPLGRLTSQNVSDEVVTIGYPAGHLPGFDKLTTYVGKVAQFRPDNKVQIADAIKGQGQSGSPLYLYASHRVVGLVTEGFKRDVIVDAGLASRVEVLFEKWPELELVNEKVAGDWDEGLGDIVVGSEGPATVIHTKKSRPYLWVGLGLVIVLLLFLGLSSPNTEQELSNELFVSEAGSLAANGKLKLEQLAYREAGEYYERAAKLLPMGNDETLADYLNWAGYAFYHAGLYNQAKPLYERSLAISKKIHGKEHPDVAASLNNLAVLYEEQGNYDQAKPLYERSLAIFEKVHGKEHPLVATSLNNLAGLYEEQGNYDQAKPLYEHSLAIRKKIHGKEHPAVAASLNNLAGLYKEQGNYDQAKPLYERSLAIFEKVHGKEHPLVATSLNNLAGLHRTQGHYDQAKPLYERSLAISKKVFGKEHSDVALILNNLAELHRTKGNYDQAKLLFERSLAIWEKIHGKEHSLVALSLNNLAALHNEQGNYDQAKPLV